MKYIKLLRSKLEKRTRRKIRVRSKIFGTKECPRLSVYRSNIAIYAQMIDDNAGNTLLAASSIKDKKNNIKAAETVGLVLAKKALEKGVKTCVFDRNGYKYHGVIKALADSCRKAGIKL